MIEYPISLILVNTIYNTLHTVFSTNSFYGCRAVAHLIAPLYDRYSTIISETPTPDLEPFRIISSSALKELRSIFFQLCNDDRLLVRREAAKQFSACLHSFGSQFHSQFVQLMRTFVSDDVGKVDGGLANRTQWCLSSSLRFHCSSSPFSSLPWSMNWFSVSYDACSLIRFALEFGSFEWWIDSKWSCKAFGSNRDQYWQRNLLLHVVRPDFVHDKRWGFVPDPSPPLDFWLYSQRNFQGKGVSVPHSSDQQRGTL